MYCTIRSTAPSRRKLHASVAPPSSSTPWTSRLPSASSRAAGATPPVRLGGADRDLDPGRQRTGDGSLARGRRGDEGRRALVEDRGGRRDAAGDVHHDAQRRPGAGPRSGWRAVSAGSSATTVPAPTTIASAQARSRCASRRACLLGGDPARGAVARGRLAVERRRDLPDHERAPGRDVALERRVQPVRLVGQDTPRARRRPPSRSRANPGPVDERVRVGRADHHARDARRRSGASVHGGVAPWWLQGSRVQTTSRPRPRVPRLAERADLGVRRPARALVPARARRPRRRRARARPPSGWATTWPQPRSASVERLAHRDQPRCRVRPSSLDRSVGAWTRHADRRRGRGGAACPFPLIPTLTVGPGIAPGPPVAGWRRGRGLSPPVGTSAPPRKQAGCRV